jgi:hemerythrin
MPLLWRSQFSVGNDLIDSDHQYLLEIINKAEVSLKAVNAAELSGLLDALGKYAKSHFEREELLARAVGYPKADQLNLSHNLLTDQMTKFRDKLGDTWTQASVTEFTAFLRDWLINHVIKEDMLMKPWLLKHSPRFDPR